MSLPRATSKYGYITSDRYRGPFTFDSIVVGDLFVKNGGGVIIGTKWRIVQDNLAGDSLKFEFTNDGGTTWLTKMLLNPVDDTLYVTEGYSTSWTNGPLTL